MTSTNKVFIFLYLYYIVSSINVGLANWTNITGTKEIPKSYLGILVKLENLEGMEAQKIIPATPKIH